MRRLPIVSDFMDKSYATVLPDTPMEEAIKLLVKRSLTGVMVVDDKRKLVGILSEKDGLKVLLQHGFSGFPDEAVSHYMHEAPMTIESHVDIIRAAQVFLDNTFRRMPVMDSGELVGQITRRDIIKGMEKYFDELG